MTASKELESMPISVVKYIRVRGTESPRTSPDHISQNQKLFARAFCPLFSNRYSWTPLAKLEVSDCVDGKQMFFSTRKHCWIAFVSCARHNKQNGKKSTETQKAIFGCWSDRHVGPCMLIGVNRHRAFTLNCWKNYQQKPDSKTRVLNLLASAVWEAQVYQPNIQVPLFVLSYLLTLTLKSISATLPRLLFEHLWNSCQPRCSRCL